MARTEAQILTAVALRLQDSGNEVWSEAELGDIKDAALVELAFYVPRLVKETVTVTPGSKEIDISGITGLLGISRLEYRVDKVDREFRNWEWIDEDTIRMNIDWTPTDTTAYLYCEKAHTLSGSTNTLPASVEETFIDLMVAKALINKGANHINTINVGSKNTLQEYLALGNAKLAMVLHELRKRRKPKTTRIYAQSI